MTYEPRNLNRWILPSHYAGELWPDYYRSGFGQSRDSDALERSNFTVALRELGGESETVIVVREGHWAVGWVEWIAIHDSDGIALATADVLRDRYESYPILDEDHFSEIEQQDADDTWSGCYSWRERIEYVRQHRSQFEFHDFGDMLACVRGHFFAGYASELLS